MGTISILGCGWLGKPLGKHLADRGFAVKGSTTQTENFPHIRDCGIFPYLLKADPGLTGERISDFFQADVIIISIPPGLRNRMPEDYLNSVRNICDYILQNFTSLRVIFISSTSVYKNNTHPIDESDEFIDESSTVFRAETLLQDLDPTVVRFAGLVGPGRHPGRFLSGKVTTGADDPVNLIHQYDCIEILTRIIELDRWGRTYNACADEHPTRRVFYDHACDMLGVPRPVFENAAGSGYKIISNDLVKRDLNYNFQFPDPLLMTY